MKHSYACAEKLWNGLENFVFDWLINADRYEYTSLLNLLKIYTAVFYCSCGLYIMLCMTYLEKVTTIPSFLEKVNTILIICNL